MDRAFAAAPHLAVRFPRSPAAQGRPSRTLIEHVRDRPGHDRRYAVDSARIAAGLGFSAATPLAAGLETTVRWYLDNEAWWRGVGSGDYRQWYARQYPESPPA
jgi:dTDP-glucose 4,6-dehydratase